MEPLPDLQGWKEIAAHLGKSVRAVQRWERELGLPVHRLKTAAGHTVFARRDELDAWISRTLESPAAVESPATEVPAAPALPPAAATIVVSAPPRARRWMAIGVAAAVVLVVTGAAAMFLRASPAPPVEFVLSGNALAALSAAGTEVWRHTFEHELTKWPLNTRAHLQRQVMRADVDGDGTREVIVVPYYDQSTALRSEQVLCFRESGELVWRFDPEAITLSFGAGDYTAPWRISDVAFSPPPGRQRIWVAIAHHTWWPSAVLELDAGGHAATRFVQSGSVFALSVMRTEGRLRLYAGGINNEYGSASVAVLDPDAVSTSPQSAGSDYQCRGCAAALPASYVLLPRTDVNRAGNVPYNRIRDITPVTAGELSIMTGESPDGAVAVMYRMSVDGEIISGSPSDSFWAEHQALRTNGMLSHDEAACPEQGARTARVYRDGRWASVRVAPTSAPRPASGAAR